MKQRNTNNRLGRKIKPSSDYVILVTFLSSYLYGCFNSSKQEQKGRQLWEFPIHIKTTSNVIKTISKNLWLKDNTPNAFCYVFNQESTMTQYPFYILFQEEGGLSRVTY